MAAQSQKWRVNSFILSMCDYMVCDGRNIRQDLNTPAIVLNISFHVCRFNLNFDLYIYNTSTDNAYTGYISKRLWDYEK